MSTTDTIKVRTGFEPFTTLYEKGDHYTSNGQPVRSDLIGKRNDKAIQRMLDKVPDAQEMINRIKWEITGIEAAIVRTELEIKALKVQRSNLENSLAFHKARLENKATPQPVA